MIYHDISFDSKNIFNYLIESKLDKEYKLSLVYFIIQDCFSTKIISSKLDLTNFKHINLIFNFLNKKDISSSLDTLISQMFDSATVNYENSIIYRALLLLNSFYNNDNDNDINFDLETSFIIHDMFCLLDSLKEINNVKLFAEYKKNQHINILKSIKSKTTFNNLSQFLDNDNASFDVMLDYIEDYYDNEIFIKDQNFWHINLPEYILFPGNTDLKKFKNEIISSHNSFFLYVKRYIKKIYS